MTLTLDAIAAHPDNATLMAWLKAQGARSEGMYFRAGVEAHPLDEGGAIFFHEWGVEVPAAAKCAVETFKLMAHERTARAFALHAGRLSVALRPGDGRTWEDRRRRAETLDGDFDVRALGPEWVVFHRDEDEDTAALFRRAYENAGR